MRSLYVSLLIILFSLVPVHAEDAESAPIEKENDFKEELKEKLLKKKYLWLKVTGGVIGVSASLYGGALIINHFRDEDKKLLFGYYQKRFFERNKVSTHGRNTFYAENQIDGKLLLGKGISMSIDKKPLSGRMIETVRYDSDKPAENTDYIIVYCGGTGQDQGGGHAYLSEIVERTGVPVVTFNYPGYGESEGKTELGINQKVASAFMEQYKDKKVILFGHSYGGSVAIDLAYRFPQVKEIFTTGTYASAYKIGLEGCKWYEKPLAPFIMSKNRYSSEWNLQQMPQREDGELLNMVGFHGKDDKVVSYKHLEDLESAANQNISFNSIGSTDSNHSSITDFAVPFICARISKLVNQ
jgi:hypothetical protein